MADPPVPVAFDLEGVVPVGDAALLVDDAQVVAKVLGAGLGRLEEAVVAGQVEGGGEAEDEPGDRVGLLASVARLTAVEGDARAVLPEVDRTALELGPQIE